MGDGRETGAVHNAEGGEAALERRQVGPVAGRRGREELGGEPGKDLAEEGGTQGAAPLEEGLGAGRHLGEERVGPGRQGLGQGVAQGPGGAEHHGQPELDEELQGPATLAFRAADGGEDGLTQ